MLLVPPMMRSQDRFFVVKRKVGRRTATTNEVFKVFVKTLKDSNDAYSLDYDCGIYGQLNNCERFGSLFPKTDTGFTANDACCARGGGAMLETDPATY